MTSLTTFTPTSEHMQKNYYVEKRGWFTSSLEAVSKETFIAHRLQKNSSLSSSHTQSIATFAIGILGWTQSIKSCGAPLALSVLASHLWSQIPFAFAQTNSTMTSSPDGVFEIARILFSSSTTGTSYDAYDMDLTPISGGNYLSSWAAYTNSYVVSARLFDGTGAIVGGNIILPNNVLNRAVPFSNDGFVIAGWRNKVGLEGQLFNSTAAKVGFPFLVDVNGTGSSMASSNAGRGFTVAWLRSVGKFAYAVCGQNYDASALISGSLFQADVSNPTKVLGGLTSVVTLSNGNKVLSWQETSLVCYGQMFDENGVKIGGKFQLTAMGDTSFATLTPLSSKGFIAIWERSCSPRPNYYDNGSGTLVQFFDETGAKVGAELQVSICSVNGVPQFPRAAPLPEGKLVSVWQSNYDERGLLSTNCVYGQLLDATGTKIGGPFKIFDNPSSLVMYGQFKPTVARTPGGGFVVTWFIMAYVRDKTVLVYGRFYPADFKGAPMITQPLKSSHSAVQSLGTTSTATNTRDSLTPSLETASTTTTQEGSSIASIQTSPASTLPLSTSLIIGIASAVFAAK